MKQNKLISNISMLVIFLIVGIRHALSLLTIDVMVIISPSHLMDILFVFYMFIFILFVTMFLFYLPMLVIIKIDYSFNVSIPPIVINKPLLEVAYQPLLRSKQHIYLTFSVIRC